MTDGWAEHTDRLGAAPDSDGMETDNSNCQLITRHTCVGRLAVNHAVRLATSSLCVTDLDFWGIRAARKSDFPVREHYVPNPW